MLKNKEKISKNKLRINLEQLVFSIIGELSKRSKDIVVKRFNFNRNERAKTLEEIGSEYEITRERVRQIEFEAISKLKSVGKKRNIDKIFKSIENNIKRHGGITGEEKITSHLFGEKNDDKINKQITLFILSLDDRIKETAETKIHKKIYFYEEEDAERFKNVIEVVEDHLKEKKSSVDFNEMLEVASGHFGGEEKFSPLHLESYLDENKIILKNILGRWGHAKWPYINPKNVRDKAYLSLKKNEEPLHFVEITNKINELWHGNRIANNQTVHNELIKDNRFVLVGRGTYALKEWGYNPGTVLDVVIKLLKEDNGGMEQSKIVQEVFKRRQVKKNTIVLNLQNKKYFERMANKVYRLK